MGRGFRISVALVAFVSVTCALARPNFPAEAHRKGFDYINGCLACHTNEATKGSEQKKGIGFNERGEWLLKLKEERSEKNRYKRINIEWLKEDPFKGKELEK